MRAAKNEIFGETPEDRPSSSGGAAPDLTSSRLQSELYLSAAYQALRLCSFLSNPTMYTIQAQASRPFCPHTSRVAHRLYSG